MFLTDKAGQVSEDLPSSRDEALGAAAALPNRSNTLLLGNEATETAFKKSVNHRIIHLAVHAIAVKTKPRSSRFYSPQRSPSRRGRIPVPFRNSFQLPLNADLVVLSACDTAPSADRFEVEEGISTLARAFLLAGTRSVVSSRALDHG